MSLPLKRLQPIQAEQVRLLYSGGISTIVTGATLATLFAGVQQEAVGAALAFSWLVGLWLVSLLRIGHMLAYRRASQDCKAGRIWRQRFRAGVLLSGAAWGSAGILLFPMQDGVHQIFLAFVLAAVIVGGIIAYSVDLFSIAGFLALTLLPFAVTGFMTKSAVPVTISMMLLLFFSYAAINVRRLSMTLLQNITLHFQAASDKGLLLQKEKDLQQANDRLIALIESIPDAIFFKDGEGRWRIVNEAGKRLFKLEGVEWQGRTELDLAAARPMFRAIHESCAIDDESTWQAGRLMLFEEQVLGDMGEVHDYEVRKVPMFDQSGSRKGLVIIGRDVSEQKRAQQELHIAAAAFDVQEGIMITDAGGDIIRVNRAFTRLTGYESEEVTGRKPAMLRSERHGEQFYQDMQAELEQAGYWQGEIWHRGKDGEARPHWLTISTIKGADGRVTHHIGAFSDISRYKEAEEAIHTLAFYDQLTGLPNRRLLLDRLQQAFAVSERSNKYGAVLFIDLDNFKSLNDTRGHAIGDRLLVEVAQRLRDCVRDEDTVARLGGDEFVVMLENLSRVDDRAAVQAESVGEKILEALNQPYQLDGFEHLSTPSIGISLFRGHGESVEELLKHADTAMYQAKQSGRNTLRFFDPAMQTTLESRIRIEAELRHALSRQQFVLYYQVQVDARRKVIGAEVLLRWQHPEHGMVSPAQFIPVAEDSGLITSIGFWVLQVACAQLKRWACNPSTRELRLAGNVSARQFRQPDFVEQLRHVLAQSEANPAKLKLELTESLVLENINDTVAKMQALRAMGIRFSMDDFGTGQSSLAQLKRLPLDQVKIDQSFVRDIATDANDAAIVQTIIAMTSTLGLNVIAEGVETEEQLAFLKQHGCEQFQGYLFGRPIPLAEFEQMLTPQ